MQTLATLHLLHKASDTSPATQLTSSYPSALFPPRKALVKSFQSQHRLPSAGGEGLAPFQSWRRGREASTLQHLFPSQEKVLSDQTCRGPLWATLGSLTLLEKIVRVSLGAFLAGSQRWGAIGGGALGSPCCCWRDTQPDPHLCLLAVGRPFIGSLSHWGSVFTGLLSQLLAAHGICGAGLSPCSARGIQSPACLSASPTQACPSSRLLGVPPVGWIF